MAKSVGAIRFRRRYTITVSVALTLLSLMTAALENPTPSAHTNYSNTPRNILTQLDILTIHSIHIEYIYI